MSGLSELEWVVNYLKSGKRSPVILGSTGKWGIGDQKVIILVAFTIPDIMVLREIHQVKSKHPTRIVKHEKFMYYAVNIVEQTHVTKIIKSWNSKRTAE